MSLSRRTVLAGLAGMGGLMMGGAMAHAAGAKEVQKPTPEQTKRFAQQGGDFSWKPQKMDLDEVAAVAHAGFHYKGYGWSYGVMYALIGLMGEKYGAPYNAFPFSCMEFGKSSTADSGGTCGCLMAGAMVMSLFYPRKVAIPMQAELFRWYEATALPVFKPAKGAAKIEGDLPASQSDSILCHISVARWCGKSGFASASEERSERCGRLTADTARKTAEIIHAQMDGTFKRAFGPSDMQKSCTAEGCHGSKKDKWAQTNLKGTMECSPCHTGSKATMDKTKNHP